AKRAVASFGDAAEWFATVDELVDRLRESLQPGINVLVKGSRSMRMERVVDALRADQGTGEH
ncbi:MAG: UDP-N-acetylmuramoyl-tripeptide--D-alanyl-D-alanine ligase, partial [Woeseia sp.]|nr:UDP-N-acetylmuramoyl-tripeptide--D-alanyl-D-alanine ligase [Woeseia sp.]